MPDAGAPGGLCPKQDRSARPMPRAPFWSRRPTHWSRADGPIWLSRSGSRFFFLILKNVEALAGLARDYKLSGSADKSSEALGRLRAINPNDPNIAKIEAMASTRSQSEALNRAGELARAGQNRRGHAHLPPTLWRSSSRWRYRPGLLPDPGRYRRRQGRRPLPACAPSWSAIPAIRAIPSHWALSSPTMPGPALKAFASSRAFPGPRRPGRPPPGIGLGFGQPRFG